jgi:hypothetical protein
MTRVATKLRISCLGLSGALLLGCGGAETRQDKLAALDNQLAGDLADPALTSALEDQITVDPALTQQSNKLAVRPAPAPAQALYPPPGGEGRMRTSGHSGVRSSAIKSERASAAAKGGNCIDGFDYNLGWANKMPAVFPVYPGAKLTDAAGNEKVDCHARVATFLAGVPPRALLDWYGDRAAKAGYSVEHQLRDGDHILAGARASDDSAYYLIITPRGAAGADVAIITANGV